MPNMNILRNVRNSITKSKVLSLPTGRKDFIRLDLNESYGIIDNRFIKELKNIDRFTLSSYPEYDMLYKKLSKYTKQPLKNICLYNGSDQAIVSISSLLLRKGDNVVVPTPTFFVYNHFIKILELKPKEIIYKLKGGKFVFPFEETISSLNQNTKALFLCNPNNPLGVVIPNNQLLTLIQKAAKLSIPIIIDEAYYEYYGESASKYIKKYKNVIILRTFSKPFGLAGLRLGYVLADQKIIENLKKIKLPWNVSHFTVKAGILALENLDYFKNKISEYKNIKIRFKKELERVADKVYDSQTNFLLCKFSNAKRVHAKLKKHGILTNLIKDYPASGKLLRNTIRMTVPSKKDYRKVISVLNR